MGTGARAGEPPPDAAAAAAAPSGDRFLRLPAAEAAAPFACGWAATRGELTKTGLETVVTSGTVATVATGATGAAGVAAELAAAAAAAELASRFLRPAKLDAADAPAIGASMGDATIGEARIGVLMTGTTSWGITIAGGLTAALVATLLMATGLRLRRPNHEKKPPFLPSDALALAPLPDVAVAVSRRLRVRGGDVGKYGVL